MNLSLPFPTSIRAWSMALSAIFVCTASFASSVPSLADPAWGTGSYSKMHMLLEKTILAIDVATIDVRVDPGTERALAKIAHGRAYSVGVEEELAKAMFAAPSAVVQAKFVREISLDQFVNAVRESLDEVHRAGLLDDALRKRVSAGLPEWFKAMKETGFREGDRVLYKINAHQLRTVVVRSNGQVVVDRTDEGADKRMILLGSYFAEGTGYREPLLRSLGK